MNSLAGSVLISGAYRPVFPYKAALSGRSSMEMKALVQPQKKLDKDRNSGQNVALNFKMFIWFANLTPAKRC